MHESHHPEDPAGNVRYDVGGWISGPMLDPPRRMVPPGSSPMRELSAAIDSALTLPTPATQRDELTYLRLHRDRARLVLLAVRRIVRDREIEDDPEDIMGVVASLREQAAQLGDDAYDHASEPSCWPRSSRARSPA